MNRSGSNGPVTSADDFLFAVLAEAAHWGVFGFFVGAFYDFEFGYDVVGVASSVSVPTESFFFRTWSNRFFTLVTISPRSLAKSSVASYKL